ncbi:MAG: hypothetical protein M0R17_05580 [Candidatus Omnitrophica bacterium]|jgi:hypothetical protein|nr:hypothetical protein [Candidatus Omnitrophota bacterium]
MGKNQTTTEQEEQIRRIQLNLCVECGINPQLEKGTYLIYPTCCRDCALKLLEEDKQEEANENISNILARQKQKENIPKLLKELRK